MPITGSNTVVMDDRMGISTTVLGCAQYLPLYPPFAKNDLTSDLDGNLSGGAGFADQTTCR